MVGRGRVVPVADRGHQHLFQSLEPLAREAQVAEPVVEFAAQAAEEEQPTFQPVLGDAQPGELTELGEKVPQRPLSPAAEEAKAAGAAMGLGRRQAVADRAEGVEVRVDLLGPDGDALIAEFDQLADGGLAVRQAVAGVLQDGQDVGGHLAPPVSPASLFGRQLQRSDRTGFFARASPGRERCRNRPIP